MFNHTSFAKSALGILVGSLAVCSAWTRTATADIIFYQGSGAVQPDENVLFNSPSLLNTGTMVQGITNISGRIANFTSSETLVTPSNGQARIEATDGFLSVLEFSLDQLLPFTEFEFNVRVPNNSSPAPFFTMTAYDTDGGVHVSQTFELGNGSNFFSIEALAGMSIARVVLEANGQIVTQLSQFRVTAIPEPVAVLPIAAIGVAALLSRGRRRR